VYHVSGVAVQICDDEIRVLHIGDVPESREQVAAFFRRDHDRFAVDSASTVDRGYGTGLGLSMVEMLADSAGWRVETTQSAEGGARFDITGVETADWSWPSHIRNQPERRADQSPTTCRPP
jgi:hypothetical protein